MRCVPSKGALESKSTTRVAIEDFPVVNTVSLVDIDLPMKLKALKLNTPSTFLQNLP